MEKNRNFSLWLTGIIAAVFALQMFFPAVTANFRLVSADAWSRPWILLTAIFLHGSVTHVLFNGLGLAMFGSILEQTIGSKRFLLLFFGAGLLSSIASTFFYSAVVGASGAIFGIIGALAVLQPTLTVWVYYIPMPMYMAAIVWAAVDVFGFVLPTGIANAGHLSGLAAGVAAGFILRGRKPISLGFGKRKSTPITAEEFDRWEKENMGRK